MTGPSDVLHRGIRPSKTAPAEPVGRPGPMPPRCSALTVALPWVALSGVAAWAGASLRYPYDALGGAVLVLEVVLVGLLGAHSRRLARDAAATRAEASSRLDRLTGANDQLAELVAGDARLFAALRCSGAEQERHRIARNLHDDVGQDLACLALTLDQVWIGLGRDGSGQVRDEVDTLRREARRIIGRVRETMADLRTDVTPERDLVETLQRFAARVTARSGMTVSVDAGPGRLPVAREREVWRIAQEAIVNAEHHAQAGRVDVHWWPGPGPALLEVRDDGVGLDRSGPAGGAGLVAMGERAAALGAALDIEPGPSGGTVVRCRLN